MAITQAKIDKIKAETPSKILELDSKIKDFNAQIEVVTKKRRDAEIERGLLKAKLEAVIELGK